MMYENLESYKIRIKKYKIVSQSYTRLFTAFKRHFTCKQTKKRCSLRARCRRRSGKQGRTPRAEATLGARLPFESEIIHNYTKRPLVRWCGAVAPTLKLAQGHGPYVGSDRGARHRVADAGAC